MRTTNQETFVSELAKESVFDVLFNVNAEPTTEQLVHTKSHRSITPLRAVMRPVVKREREREGGGKS